MQEYIVFLSEEQLEIMGCKRLIENYFPDYNYLIAKNFPDFEALLHKKPGQIPLALVFLEDEESTEIVKQIELLIKLYPGLNFLSFISPKRIETAVAYQTAGVRGILFKTEEERKVVHGIKEILAGRKILQKEISSFIKGAISTKIVKVKSDPFNSLSAREIQVLKMLLNSIPQKKIAHELEIAPCSVATYFGRIKKKLNLKTIFQIANLVNEYSFDKENYNG